MRLLLTIILLSVAAQAQILWRAPARSFPMRQRLHATAILDGREPGQRGHSGGIGLGGRITTRIGLDEGFAKSIRGTPVCDPRTAASVRVSAWDLAAALESHIYCIAPPLQDGTGRHAPDDRWRIWVCGQ